MPPEAPKQDAAPEQTQDDFLTDVEKDLAKIDEKFGMDSKKELALKEKVGVLSDKIKTLQGKADDTDKDSEKARYTLQIAALQGKLQIVEAQRSQMDVTKGEKEAKVMDRVDAKADKIDAQVKERADLEATIKGLDAKIATTEGSTDPKVITERAKLLQDRGEAKDKLARLEKKGTRAELEAKAVAYRAAEEKERPGELKQNEAATDEALAQVDKADKPAEPDAAPAAPAEGGQRSQDFNQRMSGIAFSLAKGLGDNPPDKQNIVGKVVYQGKALLLKITMAFAKHNEWVDDLTETQKTNLQETIGLKFDSNIKGENGQTVINWVPPNPDYNSDSLKVVDFLKSVLSDDAIAKIKPETTLADFSKETDPGIVKLVGAMRAMKPSPTDTVKVQDYIEEHLAELKKAFKPVEAPQPEAPEERTLGTITPAAEKRATEFFGDEGETPLLAKIDADLKKAGVTNVTVRLGSSKTDDGKLYLDCTLPDGNVLTAEGTSGENIATNLHALLNPKATTTGTTETASTPSAKDKFILGPITFPLEMDEFSAKKLDELAIGFSGNKMMDYEGNTLYEFKPDPAAPVPYEVSKVKFSRGPDDSFSFSVIDEDGFTRSTVKMATLLNPPATAETPAPIVEAPAHAPETPVKEPAAIVAEGQPVNPPEVRPTAPTPEAPQPEPAAAPVVEAPEPEATVNVLDIQATGLKIIDVRHPDGTFHKYDLSQNFSLPGVATPVSFKYEATPAGYMPTRLESGAPISPATYEAAAVVIASAEAKLRTEYPKETNYQKDVYAAEKAKLKEWGDRLKASPTV